MEITITVKEYEEGYTVTANGETVLECLGADEVKALTVAGIMRAADECKQGGEQA